jgi:tRNA(fMet)-specific endonuclease VapC
VNGYLFDTNLLSEVMRKRPDAGVMQRLRGVPAAHAFTSAVCVMELRYGAARHPRGADLWRRIERDVLGRLRVVPFSMRVCTRAGELLAALEAAGTPLGTEDVMIAATALALDLTVVTRNVRHFGRVARLRVENWWEVAG